MTQPLTSYEKLCRLDRRLAKQAHKLLDEVLTAIYKQKHGRSHGISKDLHDRIESFVDDHCFD